MIGCPTDISQSDQNMQPFSLVNLKERRVSYKVLFELEKIRWLSARLTGGRFECGPVDDAESSL